MSPTVRKRTDTSSTRSPARGGVSGVTGTSRPLRAHDRARVREVDRRHREALARDVLPHVELGPVADREHAHVLARVRRARCTGSTARGAGCFGSHWPNSSRKREHALLGARLLLVAARAADARRRSRTRRSPRAASPTGAALRLSSARAQTHACRARIESSTERTMQPLAELGGARVAERDHLGKVVPGVDVQQREREAARAERLLRQAQQHDRILAAGEEQRRVLRTRPATSRRMWIASDSSQSRWSRRRAHRASSSSTALMRTSASRDRRRSHVQAAFLAAPACSHHQRPARASSPGCTGARAGRAADRAVAAVVQRVVGHAVRAQVAPHVVLGPVGERVELRAGRARRRTRARRASRARRRLLAAQAGDPGALAGERAARAARPCGSRSSACAARRCRRSASRPCARDEGLDAPRRRAGRRRSASRSARATRRSASRVSRVQPAGVEHEDCRSAGAARAMTSRSTMSSADRLHASAAGANARRRCGAERCSSCSSPRRRKSGTGRVTEAW